MLSRASGGVKAKGQSAVVLETVPAKAFPAPKQTVAMDQRGMQFTPALLVIQQGTTVVFSNDDSVSHNVFWPNISGNKKLGHNLGTFNKGKTLSFEYDNAGNVSLLCNVHPEMSGTIVRVGIALDLRQQKLRRRRVLACFLLVAAVPKMLQIGQVPRVSLLAKLFKEQLRHRL
jgi:plastocyanin